MKHCKSLVGGSTPIHGVRGEHAHDCVDNLSLKRGNNKALAQRQVEGFLHRSDVPDNKESNVAKGTKKAPLLNRAIDGA